jgi:hypothetical protein
MKVFIAAAYARRDECRVYKAALEAVGHQVSSSWLDTTGLGSLVESEEYRVRWALKDLQEVRACDVLISFTEPPKTSVSSGRHAELGVCLNMGRRLIVVGYRENIFHWLPCIEFYASWEAALVALSCEGDAERGSPIPS